ncbi:MAG: N-formylglutamate amidohydrolase [Shimia sp.]|jgi:predicted N-formylglutamate amidohydrolase|uniref:N-formylglutamate amidohydrolase n=1 Tax=Shimia sp. TaxID=1954381 RepID=UPI0025F39812|nr:N-formylglutamate amidohydrolase [Shimia sp.]MCH2068084.1 N-formylglutamate amidohydrolase [Shimia sp.]
MTYTPFSIYGAERRSRWLITVDHAANFVPEDINGGDLGLDPTDMSRHIAYDVGARGTSLRLGELLDAPVICANWSRLCIDPNRGADDPTLVMRLYDGTIIPGNRDVDDAEIERRRATHYQPYHNALESLAAEREDVVIIAMHSFSPKLNGRAPRPWEIGVLHAPKEDRFGKALIAELEQESDLTVGDNEPYNGWLPGDSIDQHALQPGRLNALIELRHDEIDTPEGQNAWAERLAPILQSTLANSGL